MKKQVKEEQAIILDFLPNGYPFDSRPMYRKTAIAQAIGKDHFVLLELVPKKGTFLQPYQQVYMGEGKREEVHHILGKLPVEKLTETAKVELEFVIKDIVERNESRFVEFFNKSQPINVRSHQLELLPGMGKKHMWAILEQREKGEFKGFEDIKNRVKLIPDPKTAIVKRILMELNNEDKYRIFAEI